MRTLACIDGEDGDKVYFYWDPKGKLIYGQGHFVANGEWGPITPEDYTRKYESALEAQRYLRASYRHVKSEDKEFYKL